MTRGIDEGKEINPMFPRLHVKDADMGGPKAPPRNKMALYEQFNIPSQSLDLGSPSLFPLPLRNSTVSASSSHVHSSQSIQLCTSNAPSLLAEKIQAYNVRNINFTKLTQNDSINSKNYPKTLDDKDAFVTSGSTRGIVSKCPHELEINRSYNLVKRDGNEDDERYRHSDALNECTLGIDISPENVVGVIGEKEFWKARRTIINQQGIFVVQVFELHRLIKVQRLIAGSPHMLLEDNLLLNKPQPKTSAPTKLQYDFGSELPSSTVTLDSKYGKATTIKHAKNDAVGKIPVPCVNSITEGQSNQLSNYGHHLRNLAVASADINSIQSRSYVYPPPGSQWLVPVISPSEGLVYKPIIGPCLPNAGFMPPIYDTCGPMSFNPLSKDVSDASLAPGSYQKFGIISGSSLPQFLPPPFMHPSSMSVSIVEHMEQSNGPENHHSCGEVNSAIFYQGSSNMSSQTSQVKPRNFSTYHSLKDKELQRSTASSPSKRMKDVLPLFPMTSTCWPSTDGNTQVEQQPRVIKAMPCNPKSATESAARIFKSIQEERKHL